MLVITLTLLKSAESFDLPAVVALELFTFTFQTNTLYDAYGEKISNDQVTWYGKYPLPYPRAGYILFALRPGGNDGIYNDADYSAQGVICENMR